MSDGWNQGPAGLPGWDEEPVQPTSWSRQTTVLVGAGALAVLAVIGAVVLILNGGDKDGDAAAPPLSSTAVSGPPTSAPPASAPTSTSASSTGSASPTATPPALLTDIPADRKDIGYLRSVQVVNGTTYLAFDRIQFLTGPAAAAAAQKAGQEVTNDYFIVNSNPQLRNVQLAKDVQVTGSADLNSFVQNGGKDGDVVEEAPRTLQELVAYIQARGATGTTPFRFTYGADGTVGTVAEQFVP